MFHTIQIHHLIVDVFDRPSSSSRSSMLVLLFRKSAAAAAAAAVVVVVVVRLPHNNMPSVILSNLEASL
jgi:hypothetical protein